MANGELDQSDAGRSDDGDRHVVFSEATSRPGPYRGPFTEIYRWLSILFLKASGWRMKGDWPEIDKMVLVAAPHTSNWDGIYMLAAAGYYRIPLRWMGKKELSQGPFGGLVKGMGLVPVDRTGNNDIVKQMVDAFSAARSMVLAVSPEGTRSKTREWKTGFYHIAHASGVPLLMTVLDYGGKTIRLSGVLKTSGDYDADFALIKSHYDGAKGKFDKFTVAKKDRDAVS